jgi:hypothetical protein
VKTKGLKMSQKLLRNQIVEVESQDDLFEQYRQDSMEGIESSQQQPETERTDREIESPHSLEDSQGSQSLDCELVEIPKNVTPVTNKSGSEVSSSPVFDMQSLASMIQNMSEQLGEQIGKVEQEVGSVKQEVGKQLEANTKEIQEKLNHHLQETQSQLQIQVQEIKEQIKTQAKEMVIVRQECQKKYEQLKQTQSAEIAAEFRQIKAGLNKREEILEKELIGLKGQMAKKITSKSK